MASPNRNRNANRNNSGNKGAAAPAAPTEETKLSVAEELATVHTNTEPFIANPQSVSIPVEIAISMIHACATGYTFAQSRPNKTAQNATTPDAVVPADGDVLIRFNADLPKDMCEVRKSIGMSLKLIGADVKTADTEYAGKPIFSTSFEVKSIGFLFAGLVSLQLDAPVGSIQLTASLHQLQSLFGSNRTWLGEKLHVSFYDLAPKLSV